MDRGSALRCSFDDQDLDVDATTLSELIERAAAGSEQFRLGYVEPDGRTLRARVLVVLDDELCDAAAHDPVRLHERSTVTFMHQLAGG